MSRDLYRINEAAAWPDRPCRCWYFLGSVLLLLGGQQRLGELVRAGRGLRAAADALQAGDQLIDIHALGQPGDALRVAAAAADKTDVRDLIAVQLQQDLARADAVRRISKFHGDCSFASF